MRAASVFLATPMRPAPVLSVAHYDDVDEQAAALAGWNQQYLQLSAGAFRGEVQQLELDGVCLFVERLRESVLQTGVLAPGTLGLGIALDSQGQGMFCGSPCTADALHLFSGRTGFEFRTPRAHTMLGLELSPALAAGLLGDDTTLHSGIAQARPEALAEVRRFVTSLFDAVAGQPGLLRSAAVRSGMVDALLDKLALLVSAAPNGAGSLAAQWALVRRARELVTAQLAQPPSVAELCALLGVSRRTLQASFHTVLDVSPLAYLRAVRLNAARQALKSAGSVTEAATQLGFWHFGHFSQDYQALFGEQPSQTLRRHRLGSRPEPRFSSAAVPPHAATG